MTQDTKAVDELKREVKTAILKPGNDEWYSGYETAIDETIDYLTKRNLITQWQPIETAPEDVWNFDPVDLWLDIPASFRSMGVSDAFRVTDCYKENGKGAWGHTYKGKFEPLYAEYITHWRKPPPPPESEER